MSTNENELLKPQLNNINLSFGNAINNNPNDTIMDEDEIENLIMSQVHTPKTPILPQPQTTVAPVAPVVPVAEKKEVQKEAPKEAGDLDDIDESQEKPKSEEPLIINSFDIDSMNENLNNITSDAKIRIKELDKKQKLLDSRIGLLEKFILLDEKDLARELVKEKVNLTAVGQIQKSISNRTELLSQILDISLKYEDTIIKWNKTMMDIEKDKVSAFQKIRGLDKEVKTMDGDINEVLSTINSFVKENPNIVNDAKNQLSIGGYGGQPFDK